MIGDTWTSSALQQILLFGAMVAGEHQSRRLQYHYGAEFEQGRQWLAVLVEDRDDRLTELLSCDEPTVALSAAASMRVLS